MNGFTGGLVSVEDGVKSAEEYAPARKVRVEISFAEKPDGPTALELLDEAANVANAKVAELLGRTAPAAVSGEASAPATTRRRRTRAEIEADNAAALEAKAASAPEASNGGENGDAETSAADVASVVEQPADPAGMDEWASPPAEITDADLNSAVQKRNAVLNDPPKIRVLIGSYNPDPTKQFQLREIPQASRADFLAKLEALK